MPFQKYLKNLYTPPLSFTSFFLFHVHFQKPLRPFEKPMLPPRISFISRLLDVLAPRLCAGCGRRLTITEKGICISCLLTMPRTHFAASAADNPMARLFWGTINPERAAALCYYQAGTHLSHIIHEMKYYNQPLLGEQLGRIAAEEMARHGFFEGIDALVPIPITRRRQRQRGYNQSRHIALGISQMTGIPVVDGLVKRTRFTKSQTRTEAFGRQENVEGAFEVDRDKLHEQRHHHLLVIDDVVTTGATMTACCSQLRQEEDVRISIFSLCFTKS